MSDRPKIPVWATAIESWRLTAVLGWALLRALWAPAALILATEFLLLPMLPFAEESFVSFLASTLLLVLPTTLLVVPVYRLILLHETPVAGIAALYPGIAHNRYIKRAVLLDLMLLGLFPLAEIGMFIPELLLVSVVPAVFVIALYALGRLSFSLPAATIGEDCTFRQAWRITRGNGWRIFFLIFFANLPLIVLGFGMAAAVEEDLPLAWEAAASLADVVGSLVNAIALSLSYNMVAPEERHTDSATASP